MVIKVKKERRNSEGTLRQKEKKEKKQHKQQQKQLQKQQHKQQQDVIERIIEIIEKVAADVYNIIAHHHYKSSCRSQHRGIHRHKL